MRLLVLATLTVAATGYAQPGIRVYQSPNDRSITEGETTIDGDPGDVYATVLDYAKWTEIFPDVLKVEITDKRGVDAHVTLIGPNDHHDNLHFHNQPQARMIYFEDTGNSHAEVWAEIMFIPGEKSGTTRVHVRLFADVHGIASVVVSSSDVKRQREARVDAQLAGLRNYFRRR